MINFSTEYNTVHIETCREEKEVVMLYENWEIQFLLFCSKFLSVVY